MDNLEAFQWKNDEESEISKRGLSTLYPACSF